MGINNLGPILMKNKELGHLIWTALIQDQRVDQSICLWFIIPAGHNLRLHRRLNRIV